MGIEYLHSKLAAVCPIDGLSMGNPADKSTWRIDFSPVATKDQKIAARTVLANIDFVGKDRIIDQIDNLEDQITLRRIREAILGTDEGWLKNIDSQITVLRSQLNS